MLILPLGDRCLVPKGQNLHTEAWEKEWCAVPMNRDGTPYRSKGGLAMDLFSAIAARRSVRKYLSDPVPREVLQKMVAAGIEAPSGNEHAGPPLHPRGRPRRRGGPAADEQGPDGGAGVHRPGHGPHAQLARRLPRAGRRGGHRENMLLAAVAQGYASCWVEGAVRAREAELRKLLGVPDHLRVCGRSCRWGSPPRRRSVPRNRIRARWFT